MSIRELTRLDWQDVNGLHRDVWWPERSMQGWAWLDRNPIHRAISAPLGWVVVGADDKPAAFLGNFVQRFWQGEKIIYGATGFSIVVPPALKGRSRGLVTRLLAQPHCTLFYTFNANPQAAPLYKLFGLSAWPAQGHDLKLSWIVRPLDCLASRSLRFVVAHRPDLAPRLGERLLPAPPESPDPSAAIKARLNPAVRLLDDFSDQSDYAKFWRELRGEGRLVADRGPSMMRWRLSDPDQTRPPVTLVWRDGEGGIGGYAMAQLSKGNSIEPATLEIIDLCALQTRPEAVRPLVESLLGAARVLGAAKLRLQVVHPWVKAALGPLLASARREGGWGHCHVRHSLGPDALEGWRATPYEGDYGFCLRPVPERRLRKARPVDDKLGSAVRT